VLFTENRRDVTLDWVPLMRLLTPHKLFRRAFLDEHGVRFPEDGRRLEDHVFVLKAYFAGARVSVLADHPIYHWMAREDQGNASRTRIDPHDYFGRVRELLDLIEANTEPGDLRDKLQRHYLRAKLLPRLAGRRVLPGADDEDYIRELFAVVHALAVERIPPHVDAGMPLRLRLRAALIRGGDLEELRAFARFEERIDASASVVSAALEDGAARLRVEAAVSVGGRPIGLRPDGERLVWDAPELAVATGGEGVDFRPLLGWPRIEPTLVAEADRTSFRIPAESEVRLDPLPGDSEGRLTPVIVADMRVDPSALAAGKPLRAGIWQLRVRPSIAGFTRSLDLPLRWTVTADGRLAEAPAEPRRRLRSALARLRS
jgi:hypothetical protein